MSARCWTRVHWIRSREWKDLRSYKKPNKKLLLATLGNYVIYSYTLCPTAETPLNFLNEPLQTSTGYFTAFFCSLCRAAWPRSTSHTSARRTRYNNTSDSSSPKCSFSASFQSAKPRGTSPFHWKISESSPTSPTCRTWHNYVFMSLVL